MPFLTGRLSYRLFKPSGRSPGGFGPEVLDLLSAHAIGTQRVASADGSQHGWTAGDHVLDTQFDLAKNVINDALHIAFRVDSNKPPADLLRAYMEVELKALAANNPSGHPSAKQKREAKLIAKDRIEHESKDGRFIRRKAIPILWDGLSNELYVGTTSAGILDRLASCFKETFDRKLDPMDATSEACEEHISRVDATEPTRFSHGQGDDVVWMVAEDDRNFLGNEFLVWLWYTLENESDTIKLADGSEVAVMMARTLALECPRGQYGKDTLASDGPAKLPEAFRALQAGRLPRKAGLTLVRHDKVYELTLQAETLAVSSARLPAPEEEDVRARLEERISAIRHLGETLRLLYRAFLEKRLKASWANDASPIKRWLKAEAEEAVA